MATKHTPGPWCVSDHDTQEIRGAGPDYRGDIASVHVSIDPERMDADARLIAAAPDLLAALADVEMRACQDRIASGIGRKAAKDNVRFLLGALERIQSAARAALAKVRP